MKPFISCIERPSPKNALCCVWLKWPSFSGEEDYVKVVEYLNIVVTVRTFKQDLQEGRKDKMEIKSSM